MLKVFLRSGEGLCLCHGRLHRGLCLLMKRWRFIRLNLCAYPYGGEYIIIAQDLVPQFPVELGEVIASF